ncbi:unnamed protein product [Allacma fusca]|uniref:G-protein coupled receptors family 1 profile domain-containing protein n=1 Tax=Allacma fusca TaxID=39272 RepID=A0A8J2KAQ8_9HEXA|nr:unnamed protein product [Allacma fusca]
MSLATADFSFGVCLPMAVIYELVAEPSALTLTQSHGQGDFNIRPFSILIVFSAASLLSIAAIALDRFTSVAQPLRYNHFVTTSYVHRFVLAVWIYAIVMGTVGFISQPAPPAELLITWLTLFIFAPSVICCVLSYWYIYMVARSHARAIHSVEISLSRGVCSVHRNNEDQESPASSTIIATTHHPSYGLTLALILGMLFICWTPLLVSAMLDHFARTDILNREDGRALASAPILLNSLVNPWLYGFRSSEVLFM